MSNLSWLTPTPHATAVYASCSALLPPHATLASRLPATALPGPDLHRLIAPALAGAFSFDHLIRAQHYRWGYRKAKRLGGLAVHGHLELGRELHREIARFLAAQNAIHIGGGAAEVVYPIDCIREQTAVSGIVRCRIDRRYVVSGRRRYDRRAMRDHEYIRHDDKAASRLAPKGDDGRFDVYVAVNGRSD